jgi:16S rRNA (cytosine1402-N4)-methyltransferase
MKNFVSHKPVLLQQMLANLAPQDGEVYLDATFGAGGYSRAILTAANSIVYAVDRDENVRNFADKLAKDFPQNFTFLAGKFSESAALLAKKNITRLDGMVLDIGVSSMQLDDKKRGFSFDSEAKLDMRMDQQNSLTAYQIVNNAREAELAKIIREYGGEPKAKKIAKKIITARKNKSIISCLDLANIVRSVYHGYFKIDPATRTFQALRIFVNQELEELKSVLASSLNLLNKNGRLVVVSFHSLEDGIVKNFLKKESGLEHLVSRYQPENKQISSTKNFYIVNKSAISPSKEEIAANPRSRSAKMRVAIKI